MRKRVTLGVVVSGALALSALAVPAAQADGGSYTPEDISKIAQAARDASAAADGKSAFSAAAAEPGVPYALDLKFSGVKVNNGKAIVAGTSAIVSVPVSYKVTHAADIDITDPELFVNVEIYRGDFTDPTNNLYGDELHTCTATSSTTANCKGKIDVYPDIELSNADATSWKGVGWAIDFNGQDPLDPNADWSQIGYVDQDKVTTTKLQRLSKLTANASPEPVKKGKTITVTGKLSRANWDTGTYTGYSTQPVKLQFRKKSASTYTTVKTIKTNSKGELKTTVKASQDGYYRYSFAGTSTTPAVNATGDFIDVK
ncbi:hypothetical protein AB0O01_07930 [Streptomyces sp. NPDC093252]|uniref:hypothetical protein n=1 Tax=Streptomyces sp. NPDC093252 TaxID=3154980 RepID=UPI003436F913